MILISFYVRLSNNTIDKIKFNEDDFYAIYGNDTVAWGTTWGNENNIQPGHNIDGIVSNASIAGAAIFPWEQLFPRQDNYTELILNILPEIEVYYKGERIAYAKDIAVETTDIKDGLLLRLIHKLRGDPYWPNVYK